MKKLSFVIAALTVMSLSSCYVEERGGHRFHHPFWHPRPVAAVEIRGENGIKATPLYPAPAPLDIYSAKK